MTLTKAQLARRIHDLEELHYTDTAQIDTLHAAVATRDTQIVALNLLNQDIADCHAHIAMLKDFIEIQDEVHADEMALLNDLNARMRARLNGEFVIPHEPEAQTKARADAVPPGDAWSEWMRQARLVVAAQAYELLAGYGAHYRQLARTVDACIESFKGHRPHDPKEPLLKALRSIKSDCHTLADNIVVCREGGIHESFRELWPGSLESIASSTGITIETPEETSDNKGIRADNQVEE